MIDFYTLFSIGWNIGQKQPQNVSYKKLFLSISQNSQEKRHVGVSILIKLQLQGRCFPVNCSWDHLGPNLDKKSNAQKMKFPIKDFFSKCDQIRKKLWIWSHLLKTSLMENFIFVQWRIFTFYAVIICSKSSSQ